jgi:hypothetical protein
MVLGTRGPGRGVSGARRGLRHEGAVQEGGEGKGTKERGEFVGKGAGDECADAASGEGGHGAAKLDGVIHRCPISYFTNSANGYFISEPML